MARSHDSATELAERYRREGYWKGRTVIEAAKARASETPDRLAFIGTETLTFGDAYQQAEELAAGFETLGLKAGDVISFQLPNWVEAAIINLAACRIGLIVNPLVPIYRDSELQFMLSDAETALFVVPGMFRGHDFARMALRLKADSGDKFQVMTVRAEAIEGAVQYETLLASAAGKVPASKAPVSETLKMRLYTSGTTGRAKGVLHSHDTLAEALDLCVSLWSITSDDVILMPSPVTHVTGYSNGLEFPFFHGTQSLLMEKWDPDEAVSLIQQHGASVTVGATPFLQELMYAAHEAGMVLPSLRIFACGGAVVDPSVIRQANRTFASQPAFRVYGCSEAPYVSLGFPGAPPDKAAETDGRITNYDVLIEGPDGTTCADGGEGEILVRGPALFIGYANARDTDEALTADGYFRTGDLGMLRDGWLSITGRKKDLIIRGGENISPGEIEQVVLEHPDIVDVAVVAAPHGRLGEGICACVVLREGAQLSLGTLAEFVGHKGLARQKTPERIEVLASLPRTASGKVRKDELRRLVAKHANSA